MRSKGEGSIYYREKQKLWAGEISLPGGKKKTKYAKTQKEVRVWLEDQKKALRDGTIVTDEKTTVEEYMRKWYEEVARHKLRLSTQSTNSSILKKHIYPALSDVKLSKLTPSHLQALYSEKLNEGLSKRTVKYIHTLIHKALDHALKMGLVSRNVAEAVESPVPDKHPVEPLTQAQVERLLGVLQGDRLYPFYVLLLSSGLRKGEALALTTDALNLVDGEVEVKSTLNFISGKGLIVGEPKTSSSRRSVALPEFTIRVLSDHLRNRPVQSKYVFCTSKGTPFGPRNVMRHFKKALEKAGIPETVRIHDLRHTFVSYLLSQNVPPSDVQKMAGHSSFSTTVNIYGHMMSGSQKEAARKMNTMFTTGDLRERQNKEAETVDKVDGKKHKPKVE